jgi:hypothetical protein
MPEIFDHELIAARTQHLTVQVRQVHDGCLEEDTTVGGMRNEEFRPPSLELRFELQVSSIEF